VKKRRIIKAYQRRMAAWRARNAAWHRQSANIIENQKQHRVIGGRQRNENGMAKA